MTEERIRVALADDDVLLREGLASLLERSGFVVVGQRGRLLSGGQRQRIAIARATLRDAPVLVLDEPTAGLSPADTQTVRRLLRPFMAGRTTIVITHDTAVAAQADHIIDLRPVTTAPYVQRA